MLTRQSRWIAFATAAVIAGAGALASTKSLKSIPNSDGSISTCVAQTAHVTSNGNGNGNGGNVVDRKGTMRAIDTDNGESCQSDEQALTLENTQSLWVSMQADGTVLMSRGVLVDAGTGRTNVGLYQVHFDRFVSGCVATATAQKVAPGLLVPAIPVLTRPSPTQFGVNIFGLNGFGVDSDFMLVVTCNP